MYTPPYFNNTDAADILNHIKTYNFGILVSHHGGQTLATHIPFEVEVNPDNSFTLFAHIAKGNTQTAHLQAQTEVLCIFSGPHAYISPSWYTSPNVPTWNYTAVHVYGTPTLLTGEALYTRMQAMVAKYEATQEKPMLMEHLNPDYVAKNLNGITALTITPTRVEATRKLSQNRDKESYQNIINHLAQTPDANAQAIAKEMEGDKEL